MALLLKPYSGRMAWSVVMFIALAGVNMLFPAFMAIIFNDVFPSEHNPDGDWGLLWMILIGILFVYVARNVLFFGGKYTAVAVGENICFTLRNRMFEHLQQMNLRFYREHKAGKVSSRLMDDSFVIQSYIQDELPTLMQAIFRFMCLVAIIYAVNWQLALASTIVLPLHLLVFYKFKRTIKESSKVAQEQLSNVHGNLIEKFLGAEVVKGFTGEERENEAFVKAIDLSRRSQLQTKTYHVTQKIIADLLVGLGTIALLGFGAYQVLKTNNPMRPGTFIGFFSYVGMLYPTVLELMTGFAKMTKATASVDRVFDLLQHSAEEESREGTMYKPIRGHLRFEHVWFSYGEEKQVLSDVNLDILPGQVCAIVGSSGAGKSTLVSMVPRFNEPDAGSVKLDGLDIRQIDMRHLRTTIGIAFQECFLFNSSILENLRYARPDATMRQIVEVAKRTGAHHFITKLPDGYDTIVGDGGMALSRGEKQRITLTRAMLKNPKILILDEATASIDIATESQIIPSILEFMRGKTTLMITHRHELLQHADVVVQLSEGKVVYQGPPTGFPVGDLPTHTESAADAARDTAGDRGTKGTDEGILRRLGMVLLAAVVCIGAAGKVAVAEDAPAAAPAVAEATAGKLISQGGLTDVQIAELLNVAVARIRAELGYRPATDAQAMALPDPPLGTRGLVALARPDYRGLHIMQLGYQLSEGQRPAQIWIVGQVHQKDKPPAVNEEVDIVTRIIAAARGNVEGAKAPAKEPPAAAAAPAKDAPPAAPAAAAPPLKPQGKFIAMPGINDIEAIDLLDVVVARMQTEIGYGTSLLSTDALLVPDLPEFRSVRVLSRADASGVRVVQLAYRTFRSQPLHVWVYGAMLPREGGGAQPNADVAGIEKFVVEAVASLGEQAKNVTVAQLKTGVIRLSYIEPDRCLAVLKTLGFQTIEFKSGGKMPGKYEVLTPDKKIDPADLPIVMPIPAPDGTNLVGGTTSMKDRGAFGLTMTPSIANEMPNNTTSSPLMELMVLYHPAHPEQFAQLLDRIKHQIDVPARQILIEAMVLEISETGLNKLGVQWELNTLPGDTIEQLKLGRLPDFGVGESPAADITLNNIFGDVKVRLQALVRDGEAEILSRPSVLTLDGRQASIRVGEEIPVATGASGLLGGDRLEFKFEYVPVGILLNVRPRTSADGEDVSMQIDGIVSAEIPGQDLVLLDSSDTELARAPRISTRRVQTYSRVANNTPFIIGGLVSKDNTKQFDKVPILGDLPIIGKAFQSSQVDTLKREVIIVITPYVLPENQLVGRNLPKDEDLFDSFGNRLFRDAYRLRAEDVFDLAFLLENQQLKHMRSLANEVISKNADLAERYPFDRFAGNRVPGERILVYRQMYEVIKRRKIEQSVATDKLIFFRADDRAQAGFSVRFLWTHLSRLMDPNTTRDLALTEDELFRRMSGKAVAMTWTIQNYNREARDILTQPVPDVRLVDCPDRTRWSSLLWELNQPGEDGRPRFSILIHQPRDLERLRTAVILKRTVEINATRGALTLENFSIGRQLLIPAVEPGKVYLVDEEAAKYFFFTELYYPALRQELARDSEALRAALKDVSIQRLLTNPEAVDRPMEWVPLDK